MAEFAALTVPIRQRTFTLTPYRKSPICDCMTGRWRVTDAEVRCTDVSDAIRPFPANNTSIMMLISHGLHSRVL